MNTDEQFCELRVLYSILLVFWLLLNKFSIFLRSQNHNHANAATYSVYMSNYDRISK